MPDTGIFRLQFLLSIGLTLAASIACAQDYPSKTIRIVSGNVGSNVGNSARAVADGISPALGQPVIVDHRSGGAFNGGQYVSKQAPDGYTFFVTGNGFWTGPLIFKGAPYDPIKDFSPVSLVASAPAVLVVHPSVPVKSVAQLIALAKRSPGKLNYGSAGLGGITHLAAEIFKDMAGVNIVRVAYSRNTVEGGVDLLTGQVELSFAASYVGQHIKSGRLRALAVTSIKPSPLFPGLPTVAATVPGYEVLGLNAMFAPPHTPAAIIRRVNQEVLRFLNLPATRERFLAGGMEAAGSSPEQLTAQMKVEMDAVGKVIKNAGISAE